MSRRFSSFIYINLLSSFENEETSAHEGNFPEMSQPVSVDAANPGQLTAQDCVDVANQTPVGSVVMCSIWSTSPY